MKSSRIGVSVKYCIVVEYKNLNPVNAYWTIRSKFEKAGASLTFVKYDTHTDTNKEVSLQFKVVGRELLRWKMYWYNDLTVESY